MGTPFERKRVLRWFQPVLMALIVTGCGTAEGPVVSASGENTDDSRLVVFITPGPHFRHKLRVAPLVTIRNPPQMALWTESADGRYLETLFVTERSARESWRKAPGEEIPPEGIRRPEALPVWSSRSRYSQAAPDEVVTATPRRGFSVPDKSSVLAGDGIVIRLEVNHSTDFNAAYPKDAPADEANFSGGPWGSGQPSLVYSTELAALRTGRIPLVLVGHGSPDGSDGEIHSDMTGITTALEIIGEATVVSESGS